jgi:hypothetical protein
VNQQITDEVIDTMLRLICAQWQGVYYIPTHEMGHYCHGWPTRVSPVPPGATTVVAALNYGTGAQAHWSVIVCRLQQRVIEVFDSLPGYLWAERNAILANFMRSHLHGMALSAVTGPFCPHPQVRINECGIHVIENVAWALGVPAPRFNIPNWSRASVKTLFESLVIHRD